MIHLHFHISGFFLNLINHIENGRCVDGVVVQKLLFVIVDENVPTIIS